MKLLISTLLSLSIPFLSNSQSYTIPASSSLKYLYNTKNEIATIGNTDKLLLFPLTIVYKQAKFKLIKNKTGLFALVDGTGQVYKATNLYQDEITFTRIDSSRFFGNNFESIKFSFKETIYSFGGYGFWNRNGQLIHFTPGAEWSIDKINKLYNNLNWIYSYQPNESKIFYIEFPWNEESTSIMHLNTNIIEFDIEKKQNKILGKLNPQINLNYQYFNIDIQSLKGIINYNEREIYLYIFSSNKVYKLINTKIKDALIGIAGVELQTTFEDQGKVYYSFTNDTTLRSISISMNDFKEEPYPLYIPYKNKMTIWILFASMFIIMFFCLLIFYLKNKRQQMQTKNMQIDKTYTIDLNSLEFNSIEISLINKLIEKAKIDSNLTVDELNSVLGIKKKTIEIQKRVRNESINRINHKFNVNFNLDTIFIERTRSADDRRYFNYFINKENVRIFLNRK